MRKLLSVTSLAALFLALSFTPRAKAQIVDYTENFESLTRSDPAALGNAGWQVFASVLDENGSERFNFGAFPAPNNQDNPENFSIIDGGQGGPAQGAQYINTFSVYSCCDANPPANPNPTGHQNGTDEVVASIFQEQIIGADDLGQQVRFRFDATLPQNEFALDPTAAQVSAYIRTFEFGFLTAESIVDLTLDLSDSEWTTHEVLFDIDVDNPLFVGQTIQFGFENRAGDFADTGVYFDNLSFGENVSIAGDFNGDGNVDGGDFLFWQRELGDTENLDLWRSQFAGELSAVTSAAPEPSTALLTLLAAASFTLKRRR